MSIKAIGAVLFCFLLGVTGALAETKQYSKPRFQGKRLDWCFNWAADCGKPAANFFCKQMGYTSAKNYPIDHAPGSDTIVAGTGQICEQPGCDSFKSITCFRETQIIKKVFQYPKVNGKSIDHCLTAGGPCGKPTADFFCKMKQYESATTFTTKIDPNAPTVFIKTMVNCFPGSCRQITGIICQKKPEQVLFDEN